MSDSKKLRVLFLATRDWYDPGTTGGDITMWEQARYLASVGHDVTFVAAANAGAAKHEVLDGIKIVRLGGIHSLWLRTFTYYRAHCRGRFDVVVAEGFGGSRIPRMAPLYVKEPIITEWHQIHRDLFAVQYPRLLNGPLNLLEWITAHVHRDTLVRAGTEEWRRAFIGLGFKPGRVFVLPVSIREDWLKQPGIPRSEEPRILWLGKLRRYKCPDHAIRAMPHLIEQVPDAKLILAIRRDDVRYERELQSLVRELGLERHIEFRFNVTEQEKRDLICSSRVLVVPSAVEGFGIVVLEANACGVPVVASTGVPEGAVKDQGNGLRYPFGRIEALSDALVKVLSDKKLRDDLVANAVVFANQFAWLTIGARYEVIVQKAAGRRSGQPTTIGGS